MPRPAVAALLAVAALAGCMYHVPLTDNLDDAKQTRAEAYERCARSHGWDGVWDLRVHSLDT